MTPFFNILIDLICNILDNIINYLSMAAEIYHILNRGVDKRKIFLDKQDYFRFIHDLFEFNDQNLANTASYHFQQMNKNSVIESRYISGRKERRRPRKLLVDIHTFCLMPNHYHLILSPKIANGISRFMQKLNMGYSRYFNERYKRKGTLFEGRYKSIFIEDEAHFYHLPYYIHFNPLDLKFPEWREGKLRGYKEALKFLYDYRWSSHLDYLGKKNFPSVTQRDFLLKVFGGVEKYERSIKQYLKNLNLENIEDIILEEN